MGVALGQGLIEFKIAFTVKGVIFNRGEGVQKVVFICGQDIYKILLIILIILVCVRLLSVCCPFVVKVAVKITVKVITVRLV